MANVLIIDDDMFVCSILVDMIEKMGHVVTSLMTLRQGLDACRSGNFDVVFLDVQLPDGNGLDILPEIKALPNEPEVIIITGAGSMDGAELAIKSGAWDYVCKPISPRQIHLSFSRVFQYCNSKKTRQKSAASLNLVGIVGKSQAMQESYKTLARAAAGTANVLITGETGSGKEAFARTIHTNSRRAAFPFVVVDCAALPETLIESLLFGHEKGAFTGADTRKDGLFKQADKGTLFLDEIGELGLGLQKSFLRVVQEKKFRPLGSAQEIESDFRLVVATNRNLEELVAAGQFRQDLFFRLQSLVVELPPLRERLDDMVDLVQYHLALICKRNNVLLKKYTDDFLEALLAYEWPGNVRELVNALDEAVSMADGEKFLFAKHLPTRIRVKLVRKSIEDSAGEEASQDRALPIFSAKAIKSMTFREFQDTVVAGLEKEYIESLLAQTDGNIKKAARHADLGRTWFYSLLKKHNISRLDI